jgi:hypothetical protein
MFDLMEDEFTGRWDEFFSRIGSSGTPQTLGAGVISAGLAQSGAAPDQGAESSVEEQREMTENSQFAVPTSS